MVVTRLCGSRKLAVLASSIACVLMLAVAGSLKAQAEPEAEPQESWWPQWRGPLGTGYAPGGNPPTRWSEDHNVHFKVEIPGRGLASPVVWQDRLFALTAVAADRAAQKPASGEQQDASQGSERRWPPTVSSDQAQRFVVLAVDRHTGKILWQRTALEQVPHEGYHSDASWASASPVTDGRHLWASFGSRGLFCYDLEGELAWQVDLGDMTTRNQFGEGSSPAVHGDTIVVTWDHEGPSFLVALNKQTGEEQWRVERDEPTSWATPVIVERDGRAQVIAAATNQVRSYDLETGTQLWQSPGLTANVIPTPVVHQDLLIVTSGFRGSVLRALDLKTVKDGSPRVVWEHDKDTPYVPSPAVAQGTLYFLKLNKGALTCADAATGTIHYQDQKLDGISGVYASPVAAQDRVYIVGREGTALVVRRGPTFEVLATNTLEDHFDASPAIVGDSLYLRGHRWLYCLREGGKPKGAASAPAGG